MHRINTDVSDTVSQFTVYMTSTKHLSVMGQPGGLVVTVNGWGTGVEVGEASTFRVLCIKENLKMDIRAL